MNGTLNYCYIEASAADLRVAWQTWSGKLTSSNGVHFIPASGGCFVVTLDRARRPESPLAWLSAGFSQKKQVSDVERFRQSFEAGNLSPRPRRPRIYRETRAVLGRTDR